MNNDAFDQVLHEWLNEGPERGRVEALDRALAATHRTPQRRPWRQLSWPAGMFATMSMFPKLAVAVAAVVSIAVIGSSVVPTTGRPGGVQPNEGATASAAAGAPVTSQVRHVWITDQAVAATIRRHDLTDTGPYYWRAVAYDQIGLTDWTQTRSTTIVREPGTQLFEGLAEAIDPDGLHSLTFTVTPGDFRTPTILSLGIAVEAEETIRLTYVGQTGYFAMLERERGPGAYTVTAVTLPDVSDERLRAAGSGYPQDVKDLYLQVAPGSIGANARKLQERVRAEAASSAPFDLASQLVTELHSPTYTYATDVRDLDCATLSTVECFATYKRGFCQYYAATMAVLLRDLGVPTRIVEGFLPGTVDRNSGIEAIPMSSAHAWVEVYFPGHGWVMFDPTGGGRSQVELLPPE